MTRVSWVPEACDLPHAERPLRVAQFHDLFGRALRDLARPSSWLLRLTLDGSAEAEVRDLTERESACCSFFDFTLARTDGGRLTLDVAVPTGHENVLDALAAQAAAAPAAVRTTAGQTTGAEPTDPQATPTRATAAQASDAKAIGPQVTPAQVTAAEPTGPRGAGPRAADARTEPNPGAWVANGRGAGRP